MTQSISTICVQGGYHPGDGEPRQVPIYQSTTWKYDTSEHMGKLFDLEESGYFYTRLQNPTNDYVANKICELEGGTAAMLTSSGKQQISLLCLILPAMGTMLYVLQLFMAVRITCLHILWHVWVWNALL